MTLHGLRNREFVNTMNNVLAQQFRDGELQQSEAVTEFIASLHSLLKFFFAAKRLGRFAVVNLPLTS